MIFDAAPRVLMVVYTRTTGQARRTGRGPDGTINEARGPRSRKRICETVTLSRRVVRSRSRVSKPALISNRRVITIALELELARVWRGYLVFFSLGAC
jgi:hypothetical protein